MTRYTEAIRNGFTIINKNWQLVLIQFGAMFVGFIGFFVIVGIPLAIAFIIFGLDLTGLSRFEDVFRTLREPSEILSRYFALVVLVLVSLLLYITLVLALGIFLFGGSIGVISKAIRDGLWKFRMKEFLTEGKRLFFPLLGFTTLIGLIFIAVAFVLGLFGGAIAAIVSAAREQAATLALFLGIFFSLILFVLGLTLIMITLSITVYGTAVMTMKGFGPLKSLKETVRYLSGNADAFFLYCMIFGGYIVVSFFILFLSYPIGLIPLIGSLIALFYQFAVYVIQSYLGLVMLATIFSYYDLSARTHGEASPSPEAVTFESSIQGTDISGSQAQGPDDLPQERDPKD